MSLRQLKTEALQAEEDLNLFLFAYYSAGHGSCRPVEGAEDLNDSNRRMILAMQTVYGEVYLGSFSNAEPLVLYTGQKLTNFICEFCVPCYSNELEMLIRDWRENGSVKSLNHATELVERLQGKILCWS